MRASGGCWAALASDKIYAGYGAIIGSIGVRGPDWSYYDNPVSISTGILGKSVETKGGIKKYNTIEVMTGALVPKPFDTVIPVEAINYYPNKKKPKFIL